MNWINQNRKESELPTLEEYSKALQDSKCMKISYEKGYDQKQFVWQGKIVKLPSGVATTTLPPKNSEPDMQWLPLAIDNHIKTHMDALAESMSRPDSHNDTFTQQCIDSMIDDARQVFGEGLNVDQVNVDNGKVEVHMSGFVSQEVRIEKLNIEGYILGEHDGTN